MGNSKLTESGEISLNPITENETKGKLDYVGAVPVDSVTSESPETQYSQSVGSSSKRKGRFLVLQYLNSSEFFFLLHEIVSVIIITLQLHNWIYSWCSFIIGSDFWKYGSYLAISQLLLAQGKS